MQNPVEITLYLMLDTGACDSHGKTMSVLSQCFACWCQSGGNTRLGCWILPRSDHGDASGPMALLDSIAAPEQCIVCDPCHRPSETSHPSVEIPVNHPREPVDEVLVI